MNVLVFVQFSALLVFSAVLAGLDQWWTLSHKTDLWYLPPINRWPELAPGGLGWFVSVSLARRHGSGPLRSARLLAAGARLLEGGRDLHLWRCCLSASEHGSSASHQAGVVLPASFVCVLQCLRFIILLSNMIPISLYVSLEVVKVFQCTLLFNADREMYHE